MDHGRTQTRGPDLEASGVQRGSCPRMNWANRLTISRLVLTVLFVAMLNLSWGYARTTAFIIFLVAGLTDYVDGEIARRYGSVTNFRKLMDPLGDKIMMAAAVLFLAP